jgi:ABC-2 type transport system permease protein
VTSITATRESTFRSSRPRLRAVLALFRRDYLIRTSYPLVRALDVGIGAIEVLIYYFISQTFEGVTSASLGGAPSYFAFALVGITITAVVAATSSGVGFTLREEQLTGTLEALVAQPVRATEMAFGMCGLPLLMATVRVTLYLLVGGALLGIDFGDTDWLGFGAVLVATGAAMSSVGIVTGAVVLVVKRGTAISSFAIFGMSLLGGAFFPVSVLPGWLQWLGELVPPYFAFEGLRNALYLGSDWEGDALVLLALAGIGLPLAVWLFGRGLLYARRSGSLAQY